jgi:hypothetical protein
MKPTGIYVLQTTDGFRVAALESYDDLFDGYSPDIVRYVNSEKIKESFGDCVVMDYAGAMVAAQTIAKMYRECDDGIFVMKDYQFYSYEDLVNGKASKN